MADLAGSNPYRMFKFQIEVDGVIIGGFNDVSGLTSDGQVGDYREGSRVQEVGRKLPGLRKYGNITLKRGWTQSKKFLNWCNAAVHGEIKRMNGVIVLLDELHQPKMRWMFHGGWPSKIEAPALNGSANEVVIETLEITHEGVQIGGV